MKRIISKKLIVCYLSLFLINLSLLAQPTITSFTPTSGTVGTSVTITGTNFNTTDVNNIVFFGATRATVTAANATSLTVTVPTGATLAPISVLNTGTALSAYSLAKFTPTYSPNNGSITTTDFDPKKDYAAPASGNPAGRAIGDIDGDGKPDMLVVNYGIGTISIFRNTGSSGTISFATKVDFSINGNARTTAIELGDIDGDGKLDMVISCDQANRVGVFRNTSTVGNFSFAAEVNFTTANFPAGVSIGDIDGDGKPDIVAACAETDLRKISVLRNTSTGTTISFDTKVDFTTYGDPRNVAIGDFDGDGKPDIAAMNSRDVNKISVFRNLSTSGSISLDTKIDYDTNIGGYSVTTGDIDGDGKLDLISNNNNSSSISILRNTGSIGTINFAAKVDISGGSGVSIALGDLDGDGKPDVATANATNNVTVIRNTSTSGAVSFATSVNLAGASYSQGISIGDLDGDGRPDIVFTDGGITVTSVIRNNPGAIWNGANSNSPTLATNWTPNVIPNGNAITIPSGTPNSLVISGTLPVSHVTVNSGATLTVTGTLQIAATISTSGTFTATAGTIEMNGTTAQTIPASSFSTNTIENLIINNTAGVTLGGTLNVTGVYTPTAGTLTTGGHLTLKSSATATARVAQGTGTYISGNVRIERYYPAKRAWRLVTSPVAGNGAAISLNSAWRSTNGAGILLFSPTGTGFTTGGVNPNVRSFNSATQAWNDVTNTTTTNITGSGTAGANNAFVVFVTGPHNTGTPSYLGSGSQVTTATVTGKLQTGQQDFTIQNTNNQYTLIGNPYASPVDLDLFYPANTTPLQNVFYVWDPNLTGSNGYGGYITVTRTGANTFTYSTVTGTEYRYIQSGQAFFVTSNGGGSTITFQESHKVSNYHITPFRQGTQLEKLNINFLSQNGDGNFDIADGVAALYHNNYSVATTEPEDAVKFTNGAESFSIIRNNKKMSMEARPLIDLNDTIFLNMANLKQQVYRFDFMPDNFNVAGLIAYIQDAYTNTETAINLTANSSYSFTVDANANSSASNRFRIVFRNTAALPVSFLNIKAYQQQAGINVEWHVGTEVNVASYEVEESNDGRTFTKATTQTATGSSNYSWYDATVNKGDNFYRIKSIDRDGTTKYSAVVNVKLGNKQDGITVYPNPVKGGRINVQIQGEKGSYTARLLNTQGQTVWSQTLGHTGGSATQTLQMNKNLTAGNYVLELNNGTKTYTQKIVIE